MRIVQSNVAVAVLAALTLTVSCASTPPRAGSGTASGAIADNSSPDAAKIPAEVRETLTTYLDILHSSASLDECAARFVKIAGGVLVNEDGRSLRSTVVPYALKKDYGNLHFYALPPQVTRVDVRPGVTSGFGPSTIRGTSYKIWIAKAPGQPGMPAPIALLSPEGHATIRQPKVIGIGSL
ncbi:MAG: hypothetical protein R3B13_00655 [Polyangiaceae bacterium]